MTDEPLIRPVTAGTALVRLSEVLGALKRHSALLAALPQGILEDLCKRREALISAIEEHPSKTLESAFIAAQAALHQLYETISQGADKAAAATQLVQLGFPDPSLGGDVQAIDIGTLLITFSRPKKQVLTTFAFREAAGAMAYWLHEIRFLRDERLEDPIVQNYAPIFQRVRIAPGPRTFRILSRNTHHSVASEEFSFKVPEPKDFD
jgi:hypothetical protein